MSQLFRERSIVERPRCVVCVVVDGDHLVGVRQARPATGTDTTELPHEKLDPGETPVDAAIRGLAEECGLAAVDWQHLGTFFTVPAYSTEIVYALSARTDAAARSGKRSNEQIEVLLLPIADASYAVDDAVSLAALQLWQRRPDLQPEGSR